MLSLLEGDGRSTGSFDLAGVGSATTSDLRTRYETLVADLPWAGDGWEEALSHVEFPDRLPPLQWLEVDSQGRAWILRYEMPFSESDYHWMIYSATGEHVADLTVPYELLRGWCVRRPAGICPARGLRVIDGMAVVTWEDHLGVEHVSVYEVRR